MLLALVCCCPLSIAEALKCPEPPAQVARDVSIETRAKLAALGKLGAAAGKFAKLGQSAAGQHVDECVLPAAVDGEDRSA
jgi:hypothetical protein